MSEQRDVGSMFRFAHVMAKFTALIQHDRYDEAQEYLAELGETDPIVPARIAATAMMVTASATGVHVTELVDAFTQNEATDEEYAQMREALATFTGLLDGGDPMAVFSWWYEQDTQLCADLLVLAASMLASSYEDATGHKMEEPCTNPHCPIHAVRLN